MTGTDKQIKYANDIIAKTITKMEEFISKGTEKINAEEARIQTAVPGYSNKNSRAILTAWEDTLNNFKSAEFETAAEVIDFEKECGWFNYFSETINPTGTGSAI